MKPKPHLPTNMWPVWIQVWRNQLNIQHSGLSSPIHYTWSSLNVIAIVYAHRCAWGFAQNFFQFWSLINSVLYYRVKRILIFISLVHLDANILSAQFEYFMHLHFSASHHKSAYILYFFFPCKHYNASGICMCKNKKRKTNPTYFTAIDPSLTH